MSRGLLSDPRITADRAAATGHDLSPTTLPRTHHRTHRQREQFKNAHLQPPQSTHERLELRLRHPLNLVREEGLDSRKLPIAGKDCQPTVRLPHTLALIGTRRRDRLTGVDESRTLARVPEHPVEPGAAADHTIREQIMPAARANPKPNGPRKRRLKPPPRLTPRFKQAQMHGTDIDEPQPPNLPLVRLGTVGPPAVGAPAAPSGEQAPLSHAEELREGEVREGARDPRAR